MRYRTEELKAARMRIGWTQKTLAKRSGVRAPAISAIERNGHQQPETIARLAKALGIKLEDLVS